MKFSKYISLILLFSFTTSFVYATGETSLCGSESGYKLNTCRVKNICKIYKPEKPTYKTEKYEKAESLWTSYVWQEDSNKALAKAKEIYRENMGNIYKCAMVQSQKNSLNFIKEKLIPLEKSWDTSNVLGRQMELKMNKLDLQANKLKCLLIEKKKSIIKENLLKETTYEMCKYINYLSYLREYYSKTENALGLNEEWINSLYEQKYDITYIAGIMKKSQSEIDSEISHTYKVFPLVFHAYSEYENNFPIHFLLQMIHADYVLLRNKLWIVLRNIRQTGEKIVNAMSY